MADVGEYLKPLSAWPKKIGVVGAKPLNQPPKWLHGYATSRCEGTLESETAKAL
jgi:hypothetical protein